MPDTTRVIGPDNGDVVAGSGEIGRLAARGRVPLGYYGDPEASARVFPVIDGVRHAIAGDLATVEADGTVQLLGRGSQCINTGGEKVFAEEVEDAIKTHPGVADAVVLGLPDATWGESVCALVAPHPGADLDAAAVVAVVKAGLAGYKAPKRVIVVDTIGRGANGKIDYPALRAVALAAIEEGRA
jgi:acyl-CoA synthetase (AMP-forming)/AMP-acid ligase II